MPQNKYRVTDPTTGRTVTLVGDSPPTEQELEQVFSSLDTPASLGPSARELADIAAKERRTWTDTAVDALPTLGGLAGGLIGGAAGLGAGGVGAIPGSAAGAAIGGAGGEGFRTAINALRGKTDAINTTPVQALKNVASEGAIQGATDLVGGAIGKHVVMPIARGMTKVAFKPTERALKLNPNILQDILDDGIKLNSEGLATAKQATNQARQVADDLVAQKFNQPSHFISNPAGQVYKSTKANMLEITDPVFRTGRANADTAVEQVAKGGRGSEKRPFLDAAQRMEDNILSDNPAEINLMDMLRLRRGEGKAAGELWEKTGPDVAFKKQLHGDLYNAYGDAIERRVGPAWTKANEETQRRLITQQVIEDAVGKAKTDAHMPAPYDQLLLMRGAMAGNPVDMALAATREAGRLRPVVAAGGRAVASTKNVPKHTIRALEGVASEDTQARKQRKTSKAKVDALYERYKAKAK